MIDPPPQTKLDNWTIWSRWFYSIYQAMTTVSGQVNTLSSADGLPAPSMTETERDALSSPQDGTIIYNTTTDKFQGRANGAWVDFH